MKKILVVCVLLGFVAVVSGCRPGNSGTFLGNVKTYLDNEGKRSTGVKENLAEYRETQSKRPGQLNVDVHNYLNNQADRAANVEPQLKTWLATQSER